MVKFSMKNKNISTYLLVLKLLLLIFIILSPILSFKGLLFLDNIVIKIVLLAIIIGFCFIDFQLALIATMAFLILIINLNNNILMASQGLQQHQQQYIDTFVNKEKQLNPIDLQFRPPIPVPIPDDIDQTQNIVCQNKIKTNVNESLLGLYIDDKIKPYEVFIQMMTDEHALDKAQGLII
jgi:hypothetical protein